MPEIFHITHIDNLPNVLDTGEIKCKNRCGTLQRVNIAHGSIQGRRAARRVPCGPRGVVHDYVPFYFAPRSPMLYSINRGNVEGYDGDQSTVLHLVSSTEKVIQSGLGYVFTDGNAGTAISEFYDDVRDMSAVDWSVMPLQYWNATSLDPDRARRRSAEFLVYGSLPVTAIAYIGVSNRGTLATVRNLLDASGIHIEFGIKKNWYY